MVPAEPGSDRFAFCAGQIDRSPLEAQHRLIKAWGHPELVVLDKLSSLVGFKSGEGVRMEIHFEKAHGLHGDAVEPIEARLDTDGPHGALDLAARVGGLIGCFKKERRIHICAVPFYRRVPLAIKALRPKV